MNKGEDEPLSGLNGRLRPRKSNVPTIQTQMTLRKNDGKNAQDRAKRTDSPAKVSFNNSDDLSINKSDDSSLNTPEAISAQQQQLCPYCDSKFAHKQTVSKHIQRNHLLASKEDPFINCLFCNHVEATDPHEIIRHMVDSHPNQYFACLDCHTRFQSTSELAEHKLNVCEKQKPSYRSKLRQKPLPGPRKSQQKFNLDRKVGYRNEGGKDYSGSRGFNGIVISCELKPAQIHDEADIEHNITTNLILPPSKNLGSSNVIEKNAVIVIDDIQWNKRMPPNFTFHNTDADQILSRLGVVHRSPRTGESNRRDWFKSIDEPTQKFEKCFDTSFYSKVASNVQENLAKFLDGSFNFNPDPDNTIKTRKAKNSVVINTAEGFPILLAYEQFSRNVFDSYMPRALAPKHKWKWDNLENDKNIVNPDQIKQDSHVNSCIITLVASLDIWTQLSMKRKFEEKFSCLPLEKKVEKKNLIGKELKEILESREIPTSSSQLVKYTKPTPPASSLEFTALLGLSPAVPQYEMQPAVLSGEWVRPRCYVCCACGAQTRDARALSSHISTQHPNAQVEHYEIVGEMLLNADILKYLYVPPSQMSNRTRPMRGFRECTKCKISVILEDLHQHMLDCAGDTPTVRRKCRYRPFGVRRRRPRLPDNTIRKKIRKDIRSRHRPKGHLRSRPRIRTEVGDAETIRKMIADLPAKRHRVMVNQMNPSLRPRKKLSNQRNKLIRKQRSPDRQRIQRSRMIDTNNSNVNNEAPRELNKGDKPANNDKDDDDNLPLKPIIKRIPGQDSRQHEAFKGRTMLNRAKRRVHNQDMSGDQDTPPAGQPNNEQNNAPRDNQPQRIDLNDDPVNAREHGDQDRPNDRREQPNDNHPNDEPNNGQAPAQNAPLKHSIASLTASSETHDKSVQFHQLFLVQQECNNTTQHVPTERQQLFENEAAVTKLDKPPLHRQKPQLDPIASQKNKQNKPRKGLNDCIAMLRNKLEDPVVPNTGHVSVQCGSDEPLDMEPIILPQMQIELEPHIPIEVEPHIPIEVEPQIPIEVEPHIPIEVQPLIPIEVESHIPIEVKSHIPIEVQPHIPIEVEPHIDLSPAKVYSRHLIPDTDVVEITPVRFSQHRTATSERRPSKDIAHNEIIKISPKKPSLTLELISPNQKQSTTPLKRKSNRLRSATCIDHNRSTHNQLTSMSPLLATAQTSHMAQALHMLQLPHSFPFVQVAQMPQRYTETSPAPLNTTFIPLPVNDTYHTKTTRTRYRRESYKKTATVTEIPKQRVNEVNVFSKPCPKKPVVIQPERKSLTLIEIEPKTIVNKDHSIGKIPSETYIPNNPTKPKTNSISVDKQPSLPNLTEQHVEQSKRRTSRDECVEKNFNINIAEVPPAHNRNNVELIVSTPLDLSGKSLNIDCPNKTTDKSYESNTFDACETLDLSNKKSSNDKSLERETEIIDIEDMIVDLRVKSFEPAHIPYNKRSLESKDPTFTTTESSVTDLSMRSREEDYTPTDLSIKGQRGSKFNNMQREISTYEVQDLSAHNRNIVDECTDFARGTNIVKENSAEYNPTDLSGKKTQGLSIVPLPSHTLKINMIKESELSTNVIIKKITDDVPTDLSGKSSKEESSTKSQPIIKNLAPDKSKSIITLQADVLPNDESSSCWNSKSCDSALNMPQYTTVSVTKTTESALVENIKPVLEHDPANTVVVTKVGTVLSKHFSVAAEKPSLCNHMDTLNQDILSQTFVCSSINTSVATMAGSIPIYTLPNPVSSIPISRFESTTPVYTLANACISMTKIETSSTASLTNALLSVPGTTIANTTSVYTLAGTTIGTPMTYGGMPNILPPIGQSMSNFARPVFVPENDITRMGRRNSPYEISQHRYIEKSERHVSGQMSLEQDPETAKKIAMLPKELVEILGTIPAGHRNQLLNVLPQYVLTTTPPGPLPQTESTIQSTKTSDISVYRNSNTSTFAEKSPASTCLDSQHVVSIKSAVEPIINNDSTVSFIEIDNKNTINNSVETSISSQFQIVQTKFTDPPVLGITKDEKQFANTFGNSDKDSHFRDPSSGTMQIKLNNMQIESDIIDLTEDDYSQSTTEINIIEKTSQSSPREESATQIIKQKSNNEKTASLRAVRIKAPSERNKFYQVDAEVISKNVAETSAKLKISDQGSNESQQYSDNSLGLQKEERSDIQYKNESTSECSTSSNHVSYTDMTINVNEATDDYTRKIVSAPPEIMLNKDNVFKDVKSIILKTNSTVTSSTNDNAGNELVRVTSEDLKNMTPVYDSSKLNKLENETMESSITNNYDSLNVSKTDLPDLPIQCSTPKVHVLIEHKPNVTQNKKSSDDDSEDDVSLAVIVKQKQLNQQKHSLTQEKLHPSQIENFKNIGNENTNITSEDKLADNVALPYLLYKTNYDGTKYYGGKDPDSEIEKSDSIVNEDTETTILNLKNKSEKTVDITTVDIKMQINKNQNMSSNVLEMPYESFHKPLNVGQYEADKNKVSVIASLSKQESINDKISLNDVMNTETIKKTTEINDTTYKAKNVSTKEAEIQYRDILTEKSEYLLKDENSTSAKEDNPCEGIEKLKNKKKYVTETSEEKNISNVETQHNLNADTFCIDSGIKKLIDPEHILSGSSHVENIDQATYQFENKPDSFISCTSDSEVLNKEVETSSKIPQNVEDQTNNKDKTNITTDEDKSVIPLRRSRRGKSVLMENCPDVDNVVHTEVSVQQKTPLTKKQLIFSKLLLDEEIQSDIQLNSSLAKEKNITVNLNSNSTVQIDDMSTNDAIKSVKRKKSPQMKCKSKKKKSSEVDSNNKKFVHDSSHKHKGIAYPKTSKEKRKVEISKALPSSITIDDYKSKVGHLSSQIQHHHESSTVTDIDEGELEENVDEIKNYKRLCPITEKRKLSLPTVSADIGHLPKAKKTKLIANKASLDSEDTQEETKCSGGYPSKRKHKTYKSSELRTACYNQSVATRRTRSKSVFVKSVGTECYDPYDIDLDDMIDKPGTLGKEMLILDEKIVGNHIVKILPSTVTKNTKGECPVSKKIRKPLSKEKTQPKCFVDSDREDVINSSDTDDSSKSDIPLKIYAKQKEKKLRKRKKRVQIRDNQDIDQSELSEDKQYDKGDRKTRRTLPVFNNDAVATATTESEKQLRSEQFMESFGFFSERKPRKSNLLASKKIAETFHIIANDSDDMYYGAKNRATKRSLQNENKKSSHGQGNSKAPQPSSSKKAPKRGPNKKTVVKIVIPSHCEICKKEFKRPDNFLRHQMTLLHISKLSEVEMKVKTAPVPEEPNYLIVYKQQLDRLKKLTDKLNRRKKKKSKSASKITLPTMEEIVAKVNKTVREQQLTQRGLSRDEALFLDCCELLKESHKKNDLPPKVDVNLTNNLNAYVCAPRETISELDLLTKDLNEDGTKSDGDVDSITAKNILESEEVRNLENDLISGLKEAANANNAKHIGFQRVIEATVVSSEVQPQLPSPVVQDNNYNQVDESIIEIEKKSPKKPKKHIETKEKMYPDVIDTINVFEDKFDKIKRKCRSQAAAAKQAQMKVEANVSHKVRKKTEKKKGKKKSSKKNYRRTRLLTKGALKGFDGIKVSIPTSDINISAIVPTLGAASKKKRKKTSSKRRRGKKKSNSNTKTDNDSRPKDKSSPQKKVDVYEFMDNEDAEMFEFRPSTLMERFKSMSNKDTPSTSKSNPVQKEVDVSSDSVSDGDDFVYMSDDYVCSEDGSENSSMSSDANNGKVNAESKKNVSTPKKKDTFEKNAVMGKIFKHNAVRKEKMSPKGKEAVKPKTNLDQLFDSLLEEKPISSAVDSDMKSPKKDDLDPSNNHSPMKVNSRRYSGLDDKVSTKDHEPISNDKFEIISSKKYDDNAADNLPSTSKQYEEIPVIDYGPSTSKKHETITFKTNKFSSPKRYESSSSSKKCESSSSKNKKKPSKCRDSSPDKNNCPPTKKYDGSKAKISSQKFDKADDINYDYGLDRIDQYCSDDAGVARQRARRKCTVGKQNILAETWSSESEPDGMPPRPNSAESVVVSGGRRRRSKKEGSHSGTRRGSSRQIMFRRQDAGGRVNSHSSGTRGSSDDSMDAAGGEPEGSHSGTRHGSSRQIIFRRQDAGSRVNGNSSETRGSSDDDDSIDAAYCWSSEGDGEQEHLQQHGWIVGDSHKKLVTMLAHAKGRRRNNDDKRNLVE